MSLCEHSQSNAKAESSNTSLGVIALEDSSSGGSLCLLSQSIVNDENIGISAPYQATISRESTSSYVSEDKKLENVFPDLEEEISGEDESTFLSALNDTCTYPSERSDLDCSPKEFSSDPNDPQLCSPKYEVLGNLDTESGNAEKTPYNSASWTPMEIVTATGSADCTNLEHPLKLKSTYVEVQDCSETRDLNGEPLVTSYNRHFMGTVDYIWCSEGLQTVRVLAPLPKHAMQWTPGFPTKKWGSDHIALASELALTNAGTDTDSKVQ
uniref:Uncharacterized protein MANES_16G118500 n=1 Tax=Rhizophora mucronata TaxID=61149 RepID=A0A2P2LGG6_RHIMU